MKISPGVLPVTSLAALAAGLVIGRSAMTATFQRDVRLTAYYKNSLAGTYRCNNIHSTHVAHQTFEFIIIVEIL